jgi:anaerobic selenocysteine-containing dehydrogenase/ferredoxin-NADP reductase
MDEKLVGYCTLCRSRCGSVNHVENGRLVKVSPHPDHPTGGALCAKGRSAPEQVESPLRLTKPRRRTSARGAVHPEWEEISWDVALDEIASHLADIRARHGAESVAFAVTTPSGTPMVDSFEWVERFVRCFGSPNLIYAVEVCGWHKDYAHALTFGRGIGVPDLEHTDTVVLWGHNPARTWLAQASRIAASRQRGAKVVVVDPKMDGSAEQADLWIRVRPGSDGAVALGAVRHLIETNSFDHDFASRWTNAPLLVDEDSGLLLRAREFWEDSPESRFVTVRTDGELRSYDPTRPADEALRLRARGEATDKSGRVRRYSTVLELLAKEVSQYTVERVADITWADSAQIQEFNELFAGKPRLSYHAWTGLGQHTNATQTERAVATLYALTGACDREGGNLWTVAPPYLGVSDYQTLLAPEQRAKALGLKELPLGPPRHGWITARDFAKAVLEEAPYAVRALMSFGSNFLVSQADSARNERALRALDFHVHVDMFMNPTAENAHIVLPASMPWEREAMKFGFEITQAAVEHVQLRQQMLKPLGECRADYDIAFALASRLGMDSAFFGGSIEAGWNYQLEPLGITVSDLRANPDGLRFPQHFSYRKFEQRNAEGEPRGFQTPSRRVELYSEALLAVGQPPLARYVEPAHSPSNEKLAADYPVVLTTAKSGWFVHTSHQHVASLRKKSPAPQVQISKRLALRHAISNGDWIRLSTPSGQVTLQAKVDENLHDDVAVAEFGWWQGCEPLGLTDAHASGAASFNVNDILSDVERDPVSGSVPLRATLCRISRETRMNRGRWEGRREFKLVSRTLEADDIVALGFSPADGGPLPDYLPGQHVIVSLPGFDTRRAYSLTGTNLSSDALSIGVRLARANGKPDGMMSSRIHGLAVGDTVYLTQPSGIFTLPTSTRRPIILMGSGIGITPFVGYLEALVQRRAPVPDVLLINICRNGRMHPFGRRLRELAQALPTVKIITVYWDALPADRPGVDYDYAQGPDFGWIDEALVQRRALAYLCGSPTFLEEARDSLAERGIPRFDIFAETFSAETRVPDTLKPQPVCIEGEARGFDWKPELGTLLDAAEEARINLPSGCRVGQCESCEMQIVSGEVVHLLPYDGPPTSCLTCRAVPITPLVLRR